MQTLEKESESITQLVTEHIETMLSYWDNKLICKYANTAYCKWFGKTKQSIVNNISLKTLLQKEYQLHEAHINKALEGNTQTFETEITNQKGIKYALINYFPDIVNGTTKGIVMHMVDITALKLAENKLLQSNELLLIQNKRLTDFTNIIAHNLTNYAFGFSGILSLLETTTSTIKKEELFLHLKTLSKNFTDTIQNLKQIADVQNKAHLALEPINLYDYIIKTTIILSASIVASNCTIHNAVPPNTTIPCNTAYIESILTNLISNAIRYKHPSRSPIIKLSCKTENNYLILTIADNGLGINLSKYQNNLFKMYQTFHGNPDARGIGLYITKYQIEAMGGKIEVESEENFGTSFKIYFKL